MTCEVVQMRSGIFAMRDVEAGEVMHPGVGPLAEAEQLYVQQSQLVTRLGASPGKRLVLFDVGLGAGSNALSAWQSCQAAPTNCGQLEIISFERDVTAFALALQHGESFGLVGDARVAAQALLDHGRHETARTLWRMQKGDLLACLAQESAKADIVFWDPFSPRANPALWTVQAFTAIRQAAAAEATLFTYSASTTVRIAMLLAGWNVGIGCATGDKTTTTAAAVRREDLRQPLNSDWLSRVARPDVRMPIDAPTDAAARVAACPQFAMPLR